MLQQDFSTDKYQYDTPCKLRLRLVLCAEYISDLQTYR